QQQQRLQAISLLKETEEAVRSVRDAGWSTFAQNGIFHPEVVGSAWDLIPGPSVTDGFTTTVVVEDVYRDTEGIIVTNGGNLDLSTKKVTTTIEWGYPFSSTTSSVTYLTRFLENAAYTETTR